MQKLKLLLKKRPVLSLLLLFLLLELLPAFGKSTAELRLYKSDNPNPDYLTYYVLRPNGDLISWGKGPLDHDRAAEYLGVYPYLLRQKIARDVIDFACTPFVILYVDRDRVLWGSGTDEEILHSDASGRIRLLENVEQTAADARYALALKTDGSVWAWPGRDVVNLNRQQGTEPSSSAPVKIAENMQAVFTVNSSYFALTKENTLVRLSLTGGKPAPLAENVKEVSDLSTQGKTLTVYLTWEGEVYPLNARTRGRIADDVASLCENGLLKTDNSLWNWEGTFADGGLTKVRGGVRGAASSDFYLDLFGRLHWRTSTLRLPVLSRSVRWLDPMARHVFLLALALCWLYQWRRMSVRKIEKKLPM